MSEQEIKFRLPSASTVLTAVGMLGSIFGAYTTLDSRVSKAEQAIAFSDRQIGQTAAFSDQRLNRIEEKLDRLIERGGAK